MPKWQGMPAEVVVARGTSRRVVVEQVHGLQKPSHPRMLVNELDIVPLEAVAPFPVSLAHGDKPCKHHTLSSMLPRVCATFLACITAHLCG